MIMLLKKLYHKKLLLYNVSMRIVIISLIMLLLSLPASAEVLEGGVIYENGKTTTPFYFKGKLNSYGIQYDNDPYHAYYYDLNGNLIQKDVKDKPRYTYPHNTISYDAQGNVISRSRNVAPKDQYVYNPDGSFKAHWVGNKCYDANGNLMSSSREL